MVDAIKDGNVLPFRIGYVDTVRRKEGVRDEQVYGIDSAKALSDPRRVSAVTSYVLDHFDQKTKRQSSYMLSRTGASAASIRCSRLIPSAWPSSITPSSSASRPSAVGNR